MKKFILLEDNNKILLKEEWNSIDNLKKKLSPEVIAIMNDSVKDKDGDWAKSNKWSDALSMCPSIEMSKALIEIFIEYAVDTWGCSLEQLDPGKDILIDLIYQLGFKENENPYLNFIETYVEKNGGINLSQEDWELLYDLYAESVIDSGDLMGTGRDRDSHIIFNPNLYVDGNLDNEQYNIVDAYEKLSNDTFVKSLDTNAMANISIKSRPKTYTDIKKDMSPIELRNTVIFKDPKNVRGGINKFYYIKAVVSAGLNSENSLSGYLTTKNNEIVNGIPTKMYIDSEMTEEITPEIDASTNQSKAYKNILDGKMYVYDKDKGGWIPSQGGNDQNNNSNNFLQNLYKGLKNSSLKDRMAIIRELLKNGLIDKEDLKGLLQ